MRAANVDPYAALIADLTETIPATFSAANEAAYSTDRLHPGVFALAIASYAALLVAFWLLFVGDTATFLSLAVCTVYFGMFFGTPLVMHHVATKGSRQSAHGSLGRFLRGKLETSTGLIGGWGALTQVLVIPTAVTFGVLCIGLIFNVYA